MVSVTVTVPDEGLPPVLATVNVKLFPADPFTNVPLDALVIVSVGGVVVFTVTALLVPVGLPPPLTVAVFVTVAGALTTLTGIAMDGYCAPPPFRASARLQRTTAPEDALQSHPVPAGVPKVKSDATVSVTVTVPEVGLPPVLATDNVKLFPADPFTNVPLEVFVIVNPGVVVA